MKPYRFLLAIMLLSSLFAFRFTDKNSPKKKGSEAIKWMTMQEVDAANKKKPRKVFVDVYTDWCGWCKKMDQTTFSDANVAKYVNKNYYAVKFNAESKEDITFNGKTYKYNPRYKVNDLAVELLQGKMGYPSVVYLDENLKVIAPVMGYLDVPTFNDLLRFYDENHYQKQTFEEYKASRL